MIELFKGNCLRVLNELSKNDVKVDMVLTDLPYGTTLCNWDSVIPFDKMWNVLDKITHDDTPILLFGKEPFSSALRMSNVKNYKYDWVWNKLNSPNFVHCKTRPLIPLELISVFYKKAPTYNPQRRPKTIDYDATRCSEKDKFFKSKHSDTVNVSKIRHYYIDDGTRYPINLIEFNNQKDECNNSNRVHPTQKPIVLLEYLIKTYTNRGDLVLDFTMGSGSTGVACKNLNRDFIGIELTDKYFEIANKRIYGEN